MKVLITGVGGSGKTTLIEELARQGNLAIDLDKTDLCFWVNKNSGKKAEYTAGAGPIWIGNHSWRVDEKGLKDLLEAQPSTKNIYIGGKIATPQIKEVFGLFDKIFLLKASDDVLSHRQSTRTNKENKFAQSKEEQMHIREGRKKFEVECFNHGAILIDADKSVGEIVDLVMI